LCDSTKDKPNNQKMNEEDIKQLQAHTQQQSGGTQQDAQEQQQKRQEEAQVQPN
jgi:BRCT domain type II-containing protein